MNLSAWRSGDQIVLPTRIFLSNLFPPLEEGCPSWRNGRVTAPGTGLNPQFPVSFPGPTAMKTLARIKLSSALGNVPSPPNAVFVAGAYRDLLNYACRRLAMVFYGGYMSLLFGPSFSKTRNNLRVEFTSRIMSVANMFNC